MSEGSASVQPGLAGYGVTMIRENLLDIPQVPFPEGFSIRPMRADEGGLWTEIERDAEEYLPIPDDLFQREFGQDVEAIPRRCFIVVDQTGGGVGTISAWYKRDAAGQEWGLVHWVAVRPAYQRKGLGRAALSFTLSQLAQWHVRAMLGTQTRRLGAIQLYLDFGFLPDLSEPDAAGIWQGVYEQIQHPALGAALAKQDVRRT